MWVQIRVKEHLGHDWQDWFEGLQILHEKDGTSLLAGTLKDQAELYEVLWKMCHLSLVLLSLETDSRSSELPSVKRKRANGDRDGFA